MSSKRRHEGYLLIDNRNGPGISADFIRATGKDAPVVGEGGVYESATVTCAHCNAIVILNPLRTRPRHHCRKCDAYVCDTPGCAVDCTPFAAVLDRLERQALRDLANQSQSCFTLNKETSHGEMEF